MSPRLVFDTIITRNNTVYKIREGGFMQYLLTWIEGEEVCYRLVPNLNFDHSLFEEKNLIITELKEETEREKVTH